jgi:uncharacterized protein involved in outer membrane biogenesis
MKRKLLWAGGIVLGLIIIGLVIVFLTLNGIVRSTVAKSATQNLQVETTVGGASVSPFSGNVALTNVQIASPKGFAAPQMFTLGNVAVAVSYGELFGAPVKAATIAVVDPRLVIEQSGGKLNFMELANNLKTKDPTDKAPPPPDQSEPLRLVIQQLDVRGAKVELRPGIPGLKESILIDIPPLTMKNIGNADGNQNGEEVGRILTDIVHALAQKAAESDKVPPEVRQLMQLDLDQMKAQIGKRVEEQVDKVKDQVNKELEKGLGDLLNKKDKDKADKPKDKR